MGHTQVTNWRKHMVELFKLSLERPIPVDLLDNYPEIKNAMAVGEPAPMTAEVLTAKIVRFAVDPTKVNEWAIKMIYEYTVGRPQQAPQESEGGRVMDSKIEDVTISHLNQLASQFAAAGGVLPAQAPQPADGPVACGVMDLPEDGPGSSQGPGSEPEMA